MGRVCGREMTMCSFWQETIDLRARASSDGGRDVPVINERRRNQRTNERTNQRTRRSEMSELLAAVTGGGLKMSVREQRAANGPTRKGLRRAMGLAAACLIAVAAGAP